MRALLDHPVVAVSTPDPTSTTTLTQPPASATARRLVPACRHHPLFDVGSGEARDASVILQAKKYYPTSEVREGNQLFRKSVVL